MRRLADIAAPVLFISALLGLWEWACIGLHVPTYFLPAPSAIAKAIFANAPALLRSATNTLGIAILSLALASLVATTIAFLVALNRTLERAIQPIAVALQVTPIIAIAPQVVIWSGIDNPLRAVVALAAIVAFFPIFSGAVKGLQSADPDLVRLFDLYGATPLQRLFRLNIPSAVPFMIQGHKVASGLAIIGSVVGEWSAGGGATKGLAWGILEASNRFQTAKAFANLVVLAVLAVALYGLLGLLERRADRWWRGR